MIKQKKKIFEYLAMRWLETHYPDKEEPIDIRWLGVINFAIWLDKDWNESNKKGS